MPHGVQLRRAVDTCPLIEFRGRLCRRVLLAPLPADFPTFDFLYASTNASRFLGKHKAAALNGSESEETANAEFRHYQVEIWGEDLPVVTDHSATFSFEADVQHVVDLTDLRVRRHFRISDRELVAEWNRPGRRQPAPTQTLGAALFRSGCSG
jgi:RES domain